ncbi:hypothetical protein ACFQQB_62115 [Nonomuraea rubra]|uniref:hypothetical protein n=1 Tax=Nonomuraea rubra TaxID=46180 RepID=UPI003620409E
MGNTIRVRVAVAGALTAVAATGAVIGGQPADARAVATAGHVQTSIKWGECPELAPGAKRNPGQTCGTVKVPLDYRRPGGETITVAVSRIATAKPGKKRGDLLFNPGGPGLGAWTCPARWHSRSRRGAGLLRPDRVRPTRRRPQYPDELRSD